MLIDEANALDAGETARLDARVRSEGIEATFTP
jgi:hypothetical protein